MELFNGIIQLLHFFRTFFMGWIFRKKITSTSIVDKFFLVASWRGVRLLEQPE